VLGVVAPPTPSHDRLAGGQVGERANDGDQPIVAPGDLGLRLGPLGRETGDRVAILEVLVGDSLDHPAKLAEGTILGGRSVGHP
jgi:hypothetical protein